MTCGIVSLSTLQLEMKLQMCISMGLNIFKIFNLGGIRLDIRSILRFMAPLARRDKTKFDCISDDIPPEMKILNTVIS